MNYNKDKYIEKILTFNIINKNENGIYLIDLFEKKKNKNLFNHLRQIFKSNQYKSPTLQNVR